MRILVRSVVAVGALLAIAATSARGQDLGAPVPNSAAGTLMSRLDEIGHNTDMTTAKKAFAAAEEMDKFNQLYKGRPLTVRLKIQDIVPYPQGYYVTAASPDLDGTQFPATKFHVNLSAAEVASLTKSDLLTITGAASAVAQTRPRAASVLQPGCSVALPSRSNANYKITLDDASWRVGNAKTAAAPPSDYAPAGLSSGGPTSGEPSLSSKKKGDVPTDRLKDEQARGIDDIKAFFYKGMAASAHTNAAKQPSSTGGASYSGSAWNSGSRYAPSATSRPYQNSASSPMSRPYPNSASNPATGAVTAKSKHNRVYTVGELIQKFGEPSARTSTMTTEKWTFKCHDGVVHVQFKQVGYSGSTSSSAADKLKLELTSIDSASSPSHTGPPH